MGHRTRFQKKILSGELHSDRLISYRQERFPSGYQARLTRKSGHGATAVVRWGVADIRTEALDKQFKPVGKRIFWLDFKPHAYWLRFKIHNPQDEAQELVLELDKHFFSTMDLFMPAGNRYIFKHTDFIQGRDQREMAFKNLAVRLKVPPGVMPCYLRIDSIFTDLVPLRIWTQQGFLRHVLSDTAALAVITGLFLFISGYALVTFIFTKDLNYFYLSLMTCCALLNHLSFSGFGFQFLWPDDSQKSVYGLFFSLPLSFVFFFLFCRSFLRTAELTPGFDQFIKGIVCFFSAAMFGGYLLPQSLRNYTLAFFIFSEFCFYLPMLFPAVVSIKKGLRTGIYVLVGISFYIISTVEFIVSSLDILPFQLINYLNFKGISFSIIMALALFDKINRLKNELVAANSDLENTVRRRTMALSAANAKLTALDALKTKFFTNISHELRTPLTLILTPLESMLNGEEGSISKTSRLMLESMQRNADRLLRLINTLLDFSKIEAGKMAVNKSGCNLSQLISECISQLQSLADRENIQIAFEDQGRSTAVAVDPDLMEKAIFNLLANAVKFNRRPGHVRVSLQRQNETVILTVRDSGIGIPEPYLETIFDRFSQVDASVTRKYEGTGIGLSLVKEIVELHSGTISVGSRPGFGSTFTITLPLGTDQIAPPAPEDLSSPVTSPEFPPPPDSQQCGAEPDEGIFAHPPDPPEEAATILIVEDNGDMRQYLRHLLRDTYHTITAVNGKTALAAMESKPVEMVLADVMMPEMDGFELVRKIRGREKYADLPILLISARADISDRVAGIETGANDYLVKPFSSQELLARIHSQVKFRQLRKKILSIAVKKKNREKSLTGATRIKIETVKAFLEQNYHDDISRDELAAAAEMSPDHLGRMFKKETGVKIAAYLSRIRIEAAALKLRQSDDKIIDIAFEVGFGSLRTFNKQFCEVMGRTPSDYRKQ